MPWVHKYQWPAWLKTFHLCMISSRSLILSSSRFSICLILLTSTCSGWDSLLRLLSHSRVPITCEKTSSFWEPYLEPGFSGSMLMTAGLFLAQISLQLSISISRGYLTPKVLSNCEIIFSRASSYPLYSSSCSYSYFLARLTMACPACVSSVLMNWQMESAYPCAQQTSLQTSLAIWSTSRLICGQYFSIGNTLCSRCPPFLNTQLAHSSLCSVSQQSESTLSCSRQRIGALECSTSRWASIFEYSFRFDCFIWATMDSWVGRSFTGDGEDALRRLLVFGDFEAGDLEREFYSLLARIGAGCCQFYLQKQIYFCKAPNFMNDYPVYGAPIYSDNSLLMQPTTHNDYLQSQQQTKPMSGRLWLLLALFLGLTACAPSANSLVVVASSNLAKPILDSDALKDHIEKSSALKHYLVNMGEIDQQAITMIKNLLESVGLSEEKVSSFMVEAEELKSTLDSHAQEVTKVSPQEISTLLSATEESVLYFVRQKSAVRTLTATQAVAQAPSNPSQLFINMTPSVLSGLFVTLFLVVMLLIGVSCLYNIKTNDKYGVNNLVVGRES